MCQDGDVNTKPISIRPTVLFLGDTEHADFRDAAELLRDGSNSPVTPTSPELIVVAHSRPGAVCTEQIETVRRTWPLASIVVIAGSWCEGELRTGRPWPGVHRLYWYEFQEWWHRQLKLRAAGRCPDWARPADGLPLMK